MLFHDASDDPILQVPGQEPSTSSKYWLQGCVFLHTSIHATVLKFGKQVKNHIWHVTPKSSLASTSRVSRGKKCVFHLLQHRSLVVCLQYRPCPDVWVEMDRLGYNYPVGVTGRGVIICVVLTDRDKFIYSRQHYSCPAVWCGEIYLGLSVYTYGTM